MDKRTPVKASYYVLTLLAALVFTYFYYLYTWEYKPAALDKITFFTADKIYQVRVLIPILANILHAILPKTLDAIQQPFLASILHRAFPDTLTMIYQGINVLFTFGLIVTFRYLLRQFLPERSSYIFSWFLFWPLCMNYIFLNTLTYCYDIPAMFFFTSVLIFILKKKWIWFYIIFIIATFNRETSCFIAVAFFITQINKENFKKVTFHCILQAFIWIAIVVLLAVIFRENPGPIKEYPFRGFIEFLSKVWRNESYWAFKGTSRDFLLVFGCIWALIPLFWKYIPIFLKKQLIIIIPYLIASAFVANMMEVRVYNEMVIMLAAPAYVGLCNFILSRFRHKQSSYA